MAITLDVVCRGISLGGALSVDKLIEERAPPFLGQCLK